MSSINFRIKKVVDDYFDGNNSKFAKFLEVDEANIRNYIKGTEPKASFLEKVIEKTEINIEWLITGKGEIRRETSTINETVDSKVSFENKSIEEKLNMIYKQNEEITIQNQEIQDELLMSNTIVKLMFKALNAQFNFAFNKSEENKISRVMDESN